MLQHKLTLFIYLGIEVFSSGIGDLYYPSNDMDPYIKDKNVSYTCCHFISVAACVCLLLIISMLQDDDSDELEDMIINPTDSVIVYACTEDEVSYLEVSELVVL